MTQVTAVAAYRWGRNSAQAQYRRYTAWAQWATVHQAWLVERWLCSTFLVHIFVLLAAWIVPLLWHQNSAAQALQAVDTTYRDGWNNELPITMRPYMVVTNSLTTFNMASLAFEKYIYAVYRFDAKVSIGPLTNGPPSAPYSFPRRVMQVIGVASGQVIIAGTFLWFGAGQLGLENYLLEDVWMGQWLEATFTAIIQLYLWVKVQETLLHCLPSNHRLQPCLRTWQVTCILGPLATMAYSIAPTMLIWAYIISFAVPLSATMAFVSMCCFGFTIKGVCEILSFRQH